MLFSILISLVEKLPLPKPVLILLENVLEITNGINCLANTDWSIQTKYILAMTATAFGGLSGIAQTSSMVKGTSLSMKKYCLHVKNCFSHYVRSCSLSQSVYFYFNISEEMSILGRFSVLSETVSSAAGFNSARLEDTTS